MRSMRWVILVLILGSLVVVSGSASAQAAEQAAQAAVGTAFSFQGYLRIGSSPANGSYDFSFRLYEEEAGLTPVGPAFEVGDVLVTDGLFQVMLDFGAAFNGQARYLQISVRPGAEVGAYTALTPLQLIAPVPYALYAQQAGQAGSVPWSGVSGIPAGFADGLDNDTLYTAGTGLELSGGQFSLLAAYRLPQACSDGQVPKWGASGSAWQCGTDNNTTYTSGTGLELVGGAFSLLSSYRLPQGCTEGQVPKIIGGTWSCAGDNNTVYTAGDGIDITANILSGKGTPYQNVIIVAKSGGDYTSVQGAMNTINDASETNPYLVWVAPGVYQERVTMKPWVDIQGAGQNMTTIKSGGLSEATSGVVVGADNASLRDLTVETDGGNNTSYPIGIYLDTASPTIQRVTIKAYNGLNAVIGITIRNSSPLVEEVSITCSTSVYTNIYCVFIQMYSKPVFRDLSIEAQGTGFGDMYGIFNTWNSEVKIDGLKITLSGSGGSTSAAINTWDDVPDTYNTSIEARNVQIQNNVVASGTGDLGVWNRGSVVRLENGKIEVYFGNYYCKGVYSFSSGINYLDDMDILIGCNPSSSGNVGVYLNASTATLRGSKIDGGARKGVEMENSTLEAHQSQILGGTNTIVTWGSYNIRLADTQLNGANMNLTGSGSTVCTGVYDESFTSPGTNVCPP
jgi:hypothetical protein